MWGRPRRYILEGDTPVPADLAAWAAWMADPHHRIVALDRFAFAAVRVSTVFTGEDDGAGPEPLLFESTIFWPDGELDETVERHATRAEALDGHRRLVERVRLEILRLRAWDSRRRGVSN